MNTTVLHRLARAFALTVGAIDFATGVALVAAPAFTLAHMRAAAPAADALGYVRFVGVFVGAVGASYLWAVAAGGPARLRVVLQVTLLFRAAAGIFTGVAVVRGIFEPAWLLVTATDLGCVAVQAWLLAKGVGRDG